MPHFKLPDFSSVRILSHVPRPEGVTLIPEHGPMSPAYLPLSGSDLWYAYTPSLGHLDITGRGPMPRDHWGAIIRLSTGNIQLLPPWDDFRADIRRVTIDEGVTTIAANAFAGCTALEEVCLPETLEAIGHGAFSGCTALQSMELPKSLTELAPDAFRNSPCVPK